VRLVLASASPQRRAILAQLGADFEVRPTGADELEQGDPVVVALENARRKAAACPAAPGEVVLGVDTVVALDGRLFGKPAHTDEAAATLAALSGRTHEVVSGLVLAREDGAEEVAVVTDVRFRDLSEPWIAWYLGTGEWRDRAGGYAIQGRGAALVRDVRGDYLNVVGLPLQALLDLLPELVTAA
jgi:septum formation protein